MTANWLRARQADWARAATLKPCPQCRATVLAGLDADRAGLPIRCDPTPLTQFGEAAALLQGRITYDLLPAKTGRELHIRTPHFIAKARRYSVYATHKCATTLAPFIQSAPEKAKVHDDDQPPF